MRRPPPDAEIRWWWVLEEAIGIIRGLLAGEEVNHEGEHFRVEHARLLTRPTTPPPILLAM